MVELAAFEATRRQMEERYRNQCEPLNHLFAERRKLVGMLAQRWNYAEKLNEQLAATQRMSWMMRLLGGIHANAIGADLASAQRAAQACEQQLDALDADVAQQWRALAGVRSQHLLINTRYAALEDALTPPATITARMQALREKVETYRQKLSDGQRRYQDRQESLAMEGQKLEALIDDLKHYLADLEQELRALERRIVDGAQVVATTLTRVHMDELLRERRFDVVIIDEVTMATLPAIYFAASRADIRVVALGDPYQLGAIVHSKGPNAQKWLRRNVFDIHGVTLDRLRKPHPYAALLNEQARMHSAIAAVANKAVYNGRIKDAPWVDERVAFHGIAPAPGNALALCDTSDLRFEAIQPRNGFRCNGHNALCSLMIAYEMLVSLPVQQNRDPANPYRVGIVTPYRPQARLIQRLVELAGIADLVLVGTVHRFQGLEFDCVVFDMVEAPSLVPAFPFIGGGDGSEGQRLINVAVTRARHKLVIVAQVPYMIEQFGLRHTIRRVVDVAREQGVLSARKLLALPAGGAHPAWFEIAKRVTEP
jgi:hypothetical protein